jgi:hypothetical protein
MLPLQGPSTPASLLCTRPDRQELGGAYRVLLVTLTVQAQAGRAAA